MSLEKVSISQVKVAWHKLVLIMSTKTPMVDVFLLLVHFQNILISTENARYVVATNYRTKRIRKNVQTKIVINNQKFLISMETAKSAHKVIFLIHYSENIVLTTYHPAKQVKELIRKVNVQIVLQVFSEILKLKSQLNAKFINQKRLR